jgi:hypothetical protein
MQRILTFILKLNSKKIDFVTIKLKLIQPMRANLLAWGVIGSTSLIVYPTFDL